MSFLTPADAAYIKGSVQRIIKDSEDIGRGKSRMGENSRDAELARLEAFIDGCTLEKGKGSEIKPD